MYISPNFTSQNFELMQPNVSTTMQLSFATDIDNCIVVETFGFINSKFWLVKFGDRYVSRYLATQEFSQGI